VNTVMNIWLPKIMGNFFATWTTTGFSRITAHDT
jgi:hypothetical protein